MSDNKLRNNINDKLIKMVSDGSIGFNHRAVYRELCELCEFPSNMVKINGYEARFCDIADTIGVTERTLSSTLSKLEEVGLIKIQHDRKPKKIFINPIYYSTATGGKQLSKETIMMFDSI